MNLPQRHDEIHHLDFNSLEAADYDAAKIRTANMLNDTIMSGSQHRGIYLNALKWLNTLRLICNHGVLESRRMRTVSDRQGDDRGEEWDGKRAQAIFREMQCAGAAVCSTCTINLSESFCENPGQDLSDLGRSRLFSCLRLLCDGCFQENSQAACCPACRSEPRCAAIEISLDEDSEASYPRPNPGGPIDEADMPTKLRALVRDLENTRESKR